MRGSLAGRTVATAATIDHAAAQIWNPTTAPMWLRRLILASTSATASNYALRRSTARGTAGSTVDPAASNDFDNAVDLSALLDLSVFSVQPTLAAGVPLFRWNTAAIGTPVDLNFGEEQGEGILVPAGTGLVIVTPVAVILQPFDVTAMVTQWPL